MNRRQFIGTSIAFAGVPAVVSAQMAEDGWVDYEPDLIKNLLGEGKTVFVDYAASWCSTCKAQERAVGKIRAESDAYNDIVFVRVDWDEYGRHEVTTSRDIPRRSTLILLRGGDELGRLVAVTNVDEIKALMDRGV